MSAAIQSPRQVYQALRPLIDELYSLVAGAKSSILTSSDRLFVFDQTSPPVANVYNSWPALMAAVGLTHGYVWVEFRGAPTVPAGNWSFPDGVCFLGQDFSAFPTCADGCKFLGSRFDFDTIGMASVSASSVIDININSTITLRNAVVGSGAGNFAFFSNTTVPTGGNFVVSDFSEIGGLGGPGLNVTAPNAQGLIVLGDSLVPAGACVGTGTVAVQIDQGSAVTGAQTVTTFTVVNADNDITATNPGGLGPASPLVFTAPTSLTRRRTGLVTASGTMSIAGAGAAAVVVFNLLRDAVVIATATVTASAAGAASCTLVALDSLPNFAAHTYAIEAIVAAAPLTAAAGQAMVTANER